MCTLKKMVKPINTKFRTLYKFLDIMFGILGYEGKIQIVGLCVSNFVADK